MCYKEKITIVWEGDLSKTGYFKNQASMNLLKCFILFIISETQESPLTLWKTLLNTQKMEVGWSKSTETNSRAICRIVDSVPGEYPCVCQ